VAETGCVKSGFWLDVTEGSGVRNIWIVRDCDPSQFSANAIKAWPEVTAMYCLPAYS